jgi:hypothetical protein
MAVKTQTECQIIWNESLDEVEEQPNDSFIGKETENQSFVTEESNVETEEEFCSKDRSKGYYLRVFDKNTNNASMKKKINDSSVYSVIATNVLRLKDL